MTRAAIYARFSSSRQREEIHRGPRCACAREYAKAHGIDIVATYTDEAKEAAPRRTTGPGFQRMVADAGKGSFDALIVYKVDRFARNRYDSATYKAKLKRAGVELLSATEGVPDGPEGIILEARCSRAWRSTTRRTSARTSGAAYAATPSSAGTTGRRYSATLSAWTGGTIRTPRRLPPWRAAYRAAASGSTMAEIARELNGAGPPHGPRAAPGT